MTCAELLEKAERYELLGEIYRLIIPIYERKRDFEVCCISFSYMVAYSEFSRYFDFPFMCSVNITYAILTRAQTAKGLL